MQTIGERLEEARKKKGISIREAAEATKIRGDYLQRFESNQFDIGLTEIYTRGFLRNYANFLKLPADRILNDYAALGRGDIRPRQPNREIYGRMDISVATAEANERAAAGEKAPAAESSVPAQPQPRYPRGSGPTLPSGPDPAVVFKYVKWGGIAVAVVLVLLIVKSLFSGGSAAPAAGAGSPVSAQPANATAAPTYTLVATGPVFVRVAHRIGESSDGEDIWQGTMSAGQRKTIVLDGPQNVHASAGQNLKMEWKGSQSDLPFTGTGYARMDLPRADR